MLFTSALLRQEDKAWGADVLHVVVTGFMQDATETSAFGVCENCYFSNHLPAEHDSTIYKAIHMDYSNRPTPG
jgi:hypothetical protein